MITTGLVLTSGPAGRCDDYRVGGAVVHAGGDSHGEGGPWRMWYYCRDRAFDRDAPPTLGSGRVALATSKDGIRWERVTGPATAGAVLDPNPDLTAFDSLHVGLTDVTRHDGAWWMWCFGGDRGVSTTEAPAFVGVKGLAMRSGLARSTDGVNWTRVGGALFEIDPDAVYAAWPNAVHDGAQWVLQYTAPSRDMKYARTRIATSPDGRTWTKRGDIEWVNGAPDHASTGIITRHVLANPLRGGRRWLMVYTGTDAAHRRAIGAAESDDMMTWHPAAPGPIFRIGAPGAWDDFGVAATRLVPHQGKLYLYYYGFQSLGDENKARGIGLAISADGTLADFARVAV